MKDADITRSLLTDDERRRYRHVNSAWGLGIAMGLRHKNVYQGTFDIAAYLKRRTRNRLARRSRAINRQQASR